jgi:hypothetical protein
VAEKLTLPQNVLLCDRARAHDLIPGFQPKIDQLGSLKRGDWIRILVEWQNKAEVHCEFVTCMVSGVVRPQPIPGQFGESEALLVKCRILQDPMYKANHSLKYGDDLTVGTRHVLVVDPLPTTAVDQKGNTYSLTPAQIERNVSMLLAGPASAIPPAPGKQYWTRNGTVANIWTILQDQAGQSYFLGEAGGVRDIQWSTDGKHRQGNADLDIVKDPTASELVGA